MKIHSNPLSSMTCMLALSMAFALHCVPQSMCDIASRPTGMVCFPGNNGSTMCLWLG